VKKESLFKTQQLMDVDEDDIAMEKELEENLDNLGIFRVE